MQHQRRHTQQRPRFYAVRRSPDLPGEVRRTTPSPHAFVRDSPLERLVRGPVAVPSRHPITHPQGHNQLNAYVLQHVRKYPYDSVQANVQYGRGSIKGEFDVLAVRGDRAVYFECKSTDHHRAWEKAKYQFRKAARAFPEYRWQFVYVTATCIKRYRFVSQPSSIPYAIAA